MNLRKKNLSIELLRFIAVLLVINSHFDDQYTCFQELATGGAVGDALFFFCSGYTLFLGRLGRFDAWYKRRIRRIYPSVIALAFITSLFFWREIPFLYAIFYDAGWFVACILIYYVFIYFVRRFALDKMRWVYGVVVGIVLCWYILFFEPVRTSIFELGPRYSWLVFCQPMDKVWIYQWNYFKWGFFFLFMLMGASLGKRDVLNRDLEMQKRKNVNIWTHLGCLVLSTAFFYALPLLVQFHPEYKGVLIFSLIPLAGICYSCYVLCGSAVMRKLLEMKVLGTCISFVGGLCLEIYLVQPYVRTTALNFLFPLNLFILFVAMVILAYLCRAIGRFIQQTFSAEDGYEWKKVFSMY